MSSAGVRRPVIPDIIESENSIEILHIMPLKERGAL